MKLSCEQIKKIAFGAVYTEETEDGLKLFKCTPKQMAAWASFSDFLGGGSRCTTGIRLDFHTSSKYITIEATGRFELYLNGLYRETLIFDEENPTKTASLVLPLSEENTDVRVTLIFPSHEQGILRAVELEDGATVLPHTFDRKMLFIGDSITQGWNSGYDSLSYAWRTTILLNAESVIHGVGGGYFHKDIFDSIDFDPDIVIIAFGTNDFGYYKTIDALKKNASDFLSAIAEEYGHKGKKLFYISPIWREVQQKSMGSFKECRATLVEVAESYGFTHIDGLGLVPHDPEFFADKNLHPNALGFGLYAENLISELQKHI